MCSELRCALSPRGCSDRTLRRHRGADRDPDDIGLADPERSSHMRQRTALLVLIPLLALTLSRVAGAPARASLAAVDTLLKALPARAFALATSVFTTALCLAAGGWRTGFAPCRREWEVVS